MADRTDHLIQPGVDKEKVKFTDDNGIIEAVRRRAYELWEAEGRPEGRQMEHWTRAEEEILGQSPPLA
jgi:hypothetical protein